MALFSWMSDIQCSGSVTMSNASATNSLISASFRDWTAKTHAAITSGGFIDTLASGSITDPSRSAQFAGFGNLAPPTGTAHYPGFVVYRFNDVLTGGGSGSAPIFFKVEYGELNINRPSTQVSIGTTHDGSGTLGGQRIVPTRTDGQTATPTAANRWLWMLAGDATSSIDPYIAFPGPVHNFDNAAAGSSAAAVPVNATTNFFWSIERTKDQFGSASAEGIVFLCGNGGAPGSNAGTGAMKVIMFNGRNFYHEVNWTSLVYAPYEALSAAGSSTITEDGQPIFSTLTNISGRQRLPVSTVISGNLDCMRDFEIVTLSVYTNIPRPYIKIPGMRNIGGTVTYRVMFMRCD